MYIKQYDEQWQYARSNMCKRTRAPHKKHFNTQCTLNKLRHIYTSKKKKEKENERNSRKFPSSFQLSFIRSALCWAKKLHEHVSDCAVLYSSVCWFYIYIYVCRPYTVHNGYDKRIYLFIYISICSYLFDFTMKFVVISKVGSIGMYVCWR